jgi:hypothetical protein
MNKIKYTICQVCFTIALVVFGSAAFAQGSEERAQGHTKMKSFEFIQIGYSAGFKTYGIQGIDLKQQNITSVISAQMQVIGPHSIYAEFINQPMMRFSEPNFELNARPFFAYYYDAYVRSNGFNIGYAYTQKLSKDLDITILATGGQTFAEFREYLTDQESLEATSFDTQATYWNLGVGARMHYFLPNNLGLHAEVALAENSPLAKVGLTYKIKSK